MSKMFDLLKRLDSIVGIVLFKNNSHIHKKNIIIIKSKCFRFIENPNYDNIGSII